MSETIFGIFPTTAEADAVISDLEKAGFTAKDISVILGDKGRAMVKTKGQEVTQTTATGIATGGTIGGIAGMIIGVAAITLPGIGGLIVAGPLAVALGLIEVGGTTLAGALTGAAAGGLIGALVGFGVPVESAKTYEEALKMGQVLLAVNTSSEQTDLVRRILAQHGATEICNVTAEGKPQIPPSQATRPPVVH